MGQGRGVDHAVSRTQVYPDPNKNGRANYCAAVLIEGVGFYGSTNVITSEYWRVLPLLPCTQAVSWTVPSPPPRIDILRQSSLPVSPGWILKNQGKIHHATSLSVVFRLTVTQFCGIGPL